MPERRRPRVLLFGARGQIGSELSKTLGSLGDVRVFDRSTVDLSDLRALRAALDDNPADVIVNAAAYTNVDRAESEPAVARHVNSVVPEVLAAHAKGCGALLVHYSTDYVFDGAKQVPYIETDEPSPQSVYGQSKWLGDQAILASGAFAYIFRVAWVYGANGRNFFSTIQRIAREQRTLRVVADETGTPSWSRSVADATVAAIAVWLRSRGDAPGRGVYHMASPDYATRHEFATAIVEQTFPPVDRPMVQAIMASEYPSAAARPAWSVMDSSKLRHTFGLSLLPWREQLGNCLAVAAG